MRASERRDPEENMRARQTSKEYMAQIHAHDRKDEGAELFRLRAAPILLRILIFSDER